MTPRAFLARVRGLFMRDDERLSEEIRTHLELLADEHVHRGLTPVQAGAAARRDFGGVAQVKERYRDQRRLAFVDVLRQDVRDSLRSLRRAPAVTVATIVTLALGVGATTAIFAIVNAVLLKPLPYPRPEQVLALGAQSSQTGQTFLFLRERVQSFTRLAASRGDNGWNLVVDQRAEYVRGLSVTPGYFEVFGTPPLYGREFSGAEGQANGPSAVVLSHAIWRRHFSARPEAIGAIVRLGGVPHTVVGVMPPSFRSIPAVEVWIPLRLSPTDNSLNYSITGRLRDTGSVEQATTELDALKPAMLTELPATSRNFPARIERLAWVPYRTTVGAPSRPVLQLLLGGAIFVLVAACANVAVLQLIRSAARRRELAIRAALGGGRSRTARHLLTESLILGLSGATVGTAVAAWVLIYVRPLFSENFLAGQRASMDLGVLAAAAGLGLLTSIAFGAWPALDAARVNLSDALSSGSRSVSSGRRASRLRRVLVAGQVGIAGVLLVGAGLFGRAVLSLTSVDVGFEPRGVLTAETSLQGVSAATAVERGVLYDRILVRLRELPGVEAAAVASNVPIGRTLNLALEPAGRINERRSMDWVYVSPDYFTVFTIGVRAGRVFDGRDDVTAGPAAIVNETFARAYFGSAAAALGQSIQLVKAIRDNPRVIVGVVADVRAASGAGWTSGHPLAAPASPIVYVPAAQVPDPLAQMVHGFVAVHWAVRTRRDVTSLTPLIQEAMRDAAPHLPVIEITTMESMIADAVALQRTLLVVLGLFAAVTMTLATIGIYGVVAYSVAIRRHEIGIRLALGATLGRVLRSFVREGMTTALVGALVGLALAAALAGLLTGLAIGISRVDPSTYLAAGILLIGLATVASLIPSARAARVSAAEALRSE